MQRDQSPKRSEKPKKENDLQSLQQSPECAELSSYVLVYFGAILGCDMPILESLHISLSVYRQRCVNCRKEFPVDDLKFQTCPQCQDLRPCIDCIRTNQIGGCYPEEVMKLMGSCSDHWAIWICPVHYIVRKTWAFDLNKYGDRILINEEWEELSFSEIVSRIDSGKHLERNRELLDIRGEPSFRQQYALYGKECEDNKAISKIKEAIRLHGTGLEEPKPPKVVCAKCNTQLPRNSKAFNHFSHLDSEDFEYQIRCEDCLITHSANDDRMEWCCCEVSTQTVEGLEEEWGICGFTWHMFDNDSYLCDKCLPQ